jgi:hypothetical protein
VFDLRIVGVGKKWMLLKPPELGVESILMVKQKRFNKLASRRLKRAKTGPESPPTEMNPRFPSPESLSEIMHTFLTPFMASLWESTGATSLSLTVVFRERISIRMSPTKIYQTFLTWRKKQ